MGRSPCCDKSGLKKGPWTAEEDEKLIRYIELHGPSNWRTLPKNAGLERCGKSCRLRWTNYLRPDIKRGRFSFEEEETIIQLHSIMGNKWSAIAARLPGRTDNEIKNYWNTHIRKRLLKMGIDPVTHSPRFDLMEYISSAAMMANYNGQQQQQQLNLSNLLGLQALLNPGLLGLLTSLASSSSSSLAAAAATATTSSTAAQHHQPILNHHQIPQFQPGQLLPSLATLQKEQHHQQQQQQQLHGSVEGTGPSPTELSCQTSPDNSSADYYQASFAAADRNFTTTTTTVGQWDAAIDELIKSEDQGFGFDSSLESTPLTASPNINDHFNNGGPGAGGSSSNTFIANNLLCNNRQQDELDRGSGGFLNYEIPVLGSWDLTDFL